MLKILKLPTSGKKQDLIIRISNHPDTISALSQLNLNKKRFVLTSIGKEAVESIPPTLPAEPVKREIIIMERKQMLEKVGTKAYKIDGTVDRLTCHKCREMMGKHYLMSEFKIGVTAPPFHEGCICTIEPYLEDEDWAKILEGKEVEDDDGLSFDEWYEKFLEEKEKMKASHK